MTHDSVKNFSVKTVELAGFAAAVSALRLPFSKSVRSDVKVEVTTDKDIYMCDARLVMNETSVLFDEKDLSLMHTLLKNGDEHAKVLRGINVWCEVNAPRYWWQEMATYRIGLECLSSESTMHVEGKGLKEDELVSMKEQLTEGKMQKRMLMISYQTLRRIYKQRKNHRLPQWRIFCKWIESLPFADLLITPGLN